jgi:ABC-type nitrate/sulfonate/bicarbonate transport system substrate-binding protein
VRSYRDLAGKTVVVTTGTTNEAALRTLSDKQKLGITFVTAPDHAQSLETLASGKADAFATDDVLLYGFIATAKNVSDMKVVGEYLSYDPYGLVYRRDDPAFATVPAQRSNRADCWARRHCAYCRAPARSAWPQKQLRRECIDHSYERRFGLGRTRIGHANASLTSDRRCGGPETTTCPGGAREGLVPEAE